MKCPVKVISNLTIMCFIETFGDGCMVGSTISVTMMTELILGALSSYIHDANVVYSLSVRNQECNQCFDQIHTHLLI